MRLIFCHDLHLGRTRLDGQLPESDFAAAFEQIVARTQLGSNGLVIGGGLFDSAQVRPATLRQAVRMLEPFKTAGIPVLAIEGAQEQSSTRGGESWLRYLAGEGLLSCLSVENFENAVSSQPGASLEWQGARFIGVGYLGAGARRKLELLAKNTPASPLPTVLILRGPAGWFEHGPDTLDAATLNLLRERFALILLGHPGPSRVIAGPTGKPWVIVPGAPENIRLEDALWPAPRGWAEIELEAAGCSAELRDAVRRTVYHTEVDVTPFGNKLKHGIEAIAAAGVHALNELKARAESNGAGTLAPAARLLLKGELNIGRVAPDPLLLGRKLAEETGFAAVDVRLDGVAYFTGRPAKPGVPGAVPAQALNADTPPAEVETWAIREALRELYQEEHGRDLPEAELTQLAELCAGLRDGIARKSSASEVLALLENSERRAINAVPKTGA